MSSVVSVRVRREVKEELERAGIDVGEEVRRHLEELVVKLRAKRLVDKWDKLLESVKPSPPGFSVESVREDREGH